MRMPNIETDFWELRSGEAAHIEHPDTFWIPSAEERNSLQIGQAAKLIFDIEGEDEEGNIHVEGERMWVIISEIIDDGYIGILDNQPLSFEPSDEV